MTWPRTIYVATLSAGVFVTNNFTDPSTQPVWSPVNTGLPTLGCREFWLDPFEPAARQYVLLESDRTLYMRPGGGSWSPILTPAQCYAMTPTPNASIKGFCVDPSIPGRLWANYGTVSITDWGCTRSAFYTDDYGDHWSYSTFYTGLYTYGFGVIRAHGDNVYVMSATNSSSRIYYTSNKGATWGYTGIDFQTEHPIILNKLTPSWVYCPQNTGGATHYDRLVMVSNDGTLTTLQDYMSPGDVDVMWFHPTDPNHQRMVRGGRLYVTEDAWTTKNTPSPISPTPVSIAPYVSDDPDQILVGLTLGTHVIGALVGESDTTAVGIAGANAGTAPYTGSIPSTCGGVARMGVQAVPNTGQIYTYNVSFA